MRSPLDMGYPQLLLVTLTIIMVGALLVTASTSSASFSSYNLAWNGASQLQSEASAAGAESEVIQKTTAYGDANPNDTVALVLSPESPYNAAERARVSKFVRDGGTLVVAEDFGSHSNPLLQSVGARARIDGRVVRDEQYNYRSPAIPVARNVSNQSLTRGVDALTLNYGTVVRPHNATVLANTSEYAYLDVNRNRKLDSNEMVAERSVAVTERIGDGRIVVVSDPSLFVNAMLERSGNRRFVRQLFEGHETVLLDYSHSTELPPLALAVLTLRTSPLLQVIVGIVGIGCIAAWRQRLGLRRRISEFRRSAAEANRPRVGERELTAYVENHYPEWDSERVERVVEAFEEKRRE